MSDGTGTSADDVAYQNTADQVWARKALDLYQQHLLQVKAFNTDGVVSAQVWGPCPRCGHDINVQPTLTAPLLGLRRSWLATLAGRATPGGGEIPTIVEVGCGCGRAHPDAPDKPDASGKILGCGVSFRLPTTPPATPPGTSPAVPAPAGPQESR